MARRDLLDEKAPDDLRHVLDGPMVRALLAGPLGDGARDPDPYRKWTGIHWRLVSLVELEATGDPRLLAWLDRELEWLTGHGRLTRRRMVDGQPLSDASIEGNGLAVACRLGRADDSRAAQVAEALLRWQWRDGGWNCDARASGRRSSFHESLIPMWALFEYGRATRQTDATDAAHRAAELLLEHRVFRRHGTGAPIHPSWVKLHYPPFWHYDVLQALHLLARLDRLTDARASDALDLLEQQRLPDGRWRSGGRWYRPPGGSSAPDAVDWGAGDGDRIITLNALRVLRTAGRWPAARG
jgi:hypothetical protein